MSLKIIYPPILIAKDNIILLLIEAIILRMSSQILPTTNKFKTTVYHSSKNQIILIMEIIQTIIFNNKVASNTIIQKVETIFYQKLITNNKMNKV